MPWHILKDVYIYVYIYGADYLLRSCPKARWPMPKARCCSRRTRNPRFGNDRQDPLQDLGCLRIWLRLKGSGVLLEYGQGFT